MIFTQSGRLGGMENKKLLFSVTKNDLTRQTFAVGGPGGQHKNAKQNCVRFIHPPSGAVGQGIVHREQYKNERDALKNLAETKEFKIWHKAECARRLGVKQETIDELKLRLAEKIDRMIVDQLKSGEILVEYVDGK